MTDYKQLCAELVEQLDDALDFTVSSETRRHMKLLTRKARAALVEPEPEGLTDQELLEVLDRATADFPPNHPEAEPMTGARYALTLELRKARAAIAADRARRPAPQPPGDGQVAELVNHARSSNTQAVALAVALEQLADAADEKTLISNEGGPAGGADGKALSEAVKRARKTLNPATPKPDIIQKPQFPPPELVQQWYDAARGPRCEQELATQAARWGYDQAIKELEEFLEKQNDRC